MKIAVSMSVGSRRCPSGGQRFHGGPDNLRPLRKCRVQKSSVILSEGSREMCLNEGFHRAGVEGPLWLNRRGASYRKRPSPQNGGLALSGVSKSRLRLSLGKRTKVLRLGSAQRQGKCKFSVRLAQDDGFGKRGFRRGLNLLSGWPKATGGHHRL